MSKHQMLDRSRPPGPGEVLPLRLPEVVPDTLENGLDLLMVGHGDLPLVGIRLVLNRGAADEPPELGGLAHLVGQTLESGTRTRDGSEVAWAIERLGTELTVDVGWDATLLGMTVPADRLEPALDILADLIRDPAFPADEVSRHRDLQLAELLQRRKQPGSLANDMAAHFIFAAGVPYRRPLMGLATSVQRLTREHVESFYREHFHPSSAALVLVGDVDPGVAPSLARRYFGDWSGDATSRPSFDVQPAVEGTTIFVVDRPGAVQSEIRIGDVGVRRSDDDYFPLIVMNTILGGAFTSRLNMSLRERHGFTYGVRSSFAFRREPGPFTVRAAVGTDVTAPAVREAHREIGRLRDEGPTDDEVEMARAYLSGVLPLRLQTVGEVAGRLGEIFIYDLPRDYLTSYRERIGDVGVEDVRRVARERLRMDRLAVVVVGAAESIAGPLEDLRLGDVRVESAGEVVS